MKYGPAGPRSNTIKRGGSAAVSTPTPAGSTTHSPASFMPTPSNSAGTA